MQSRAVSETRTIGFGACGNPAPMGRSTQMRQACKARASASRLSPAFAGISIMQHPRRRTPAQPNAEQS